MTASAAKQTGPQRESLLSRIADGGPTLPLVVFFGLNAVDELDRSAAAILTPEIRQHFDLSRARYLGFVALVVLGGLLLQPVVAIFADRYRRIRLALIGAILWALFSFMTGLALGMVLFFVARAGSGIGKAVNDPTHRSLLADWYRPQTRPKVYSLHAAANAVGATVGPLSAGLLAYYFGWRTPFLFFAIPTLIFVAVGLRLREPVRGAQERALAGGSSEAISTEELPPSAAEAWRMCWKIQALRRIWLATPFLSASLIGFGTLASELYADAYGLDERARGIVAAASEPGQLIGLFIGARIATKLLERDPGLILRFLALVSTITSALSGVFAIVPSLAVAIAANVTIALCLAIVGPGIVASLSLAIPPRARAMGFSIGSLFIIPGLLILPMIGWIADSWGIRTGMSVMVPVFFIGGLVISTGGNVISTDIEQVRRTTLARAEVLAARRRGEVKLLYCKDVSAGYDGVTVLHGIDFEVDKGEIVALLGTNGAGKSTFLKAVSGVVQADRGAIIFDGRDVTHAPPNEIAGFGIVQIPGGAGVFPGLTVGENLEAAGWLTRRNHSEQSAAHAKVLEAFHELTERLDDRAADLSGGQQQMLALGMTFLLKPKLLMVDELSLGLAPIVVERLLRMVREIAAEGVTVILVEQSVNVALELAETAYFMERGRIRFNGPTQELLKRRDLLRSVFLGDVGDLQTEDETTPDTEVKPDLEVQTRQSPELLKVTGLARRFGGVHAVSDVSFTVDAGEIVGFIGPNGAGKTTLFDLIAGSTSADSGTVVLSGRDVSRQSASARARQGLGRSFQDARLFPSLTVTEVIAVSLERWISWGDPVTAALYLPMAFDSEASVSNRVEELIELMGLERYRHMRVRELSTGTRRVVDLACVLAHRATVVLLDEPSSGIAQSEVEALAPLLLRMRSELGASLLVIEHDMNLVTAICDRVLALDQGTVVATGSPAEVLNDPKVLAAYLGNPAR